LHSGDEQVRSTGEVGVVVRTGGERVRGRDDVRVLSCGSRERKRREGCAQLLGPPSRELSCGFRTRSGMTAALENGAVDVVGLTRPITHEPDFPRRILDGSTETSLPRPQRVGVKLVDDLLNSAWHQ
jgi:2,4-dienoyl-CoA reductase-like NADH-dependent reductase (Old Yellow Enzyme family)